MLGVVRASSSRSCLAVSTYRKPTRSSSSSSSLPRKFRTHYRKNDGHRDYATASEKPELQRERFGWGSALLIAFGLAACAGIGHYLWDPDLKKTKKLMQENGFDPDELDKRIKSKLHSTFGPPAAPAAVETPKSVSSNPNISSASTTPSSTINIATPSVVSASVAAVKPEGAAVEQPAHSFVAASPVPTEPSTTSEKPTENKNSKSTTSNNSPPAEVLAESPGMHTARAAAAPVSVSEQNGLATALAMEAIEVPTPSKTANELAATKAYYEAELQKLQSSMDYKITEAVDEAKRMLEQHYRKRFEQTVLVMTSKTEQQLQAKYEAQLQATKDDLATKLHEMEAAYKSAKQDREEKLHQLIAATEKYREKVEHSFVTRTDSLKVSHICLTLFALRNAMDRHEPLEPHIRTLRTLGSKEDMVNTVLKGIPSEAIKNGVPTMANLQQRFTRVKEVARRVTLVPEDGGGLMWHVFAGVLARVLVPPRGLVQGDEPEAKLARAEYHLQQGELLQSVQELESMPPAAREVAHDWLKEARARLLADQATSVLEAHALTLISNLSKPANG